MLLKPKGRENIFFRGPSGILQYRIFLALPNLWFATWWPSRKRRESWKRRRQLRQPHECWIRGNHGNHDNEENHASLGGQIMGSPNNGFRNRFLGIPLWWQEGEPIHVSPLDMDSDAIGDRELPCALPSSLPSPRLHTEAHDKSKDFSVCLGAEERA